MTLDGPVLENGSSVPNKLMVEEVQVGGATAVGGTTRWTLEGTRNGRICLNVHGSHLQEGVQKQQQKRPPAEIEIGYP